MRGKYRPHHFLQVVLLFIALSGFSASNSKANENSKYLDAVREFADNVLKYGRDTYGPKHTPLFVDGLNIHTHEPVKWISPKGERWILSNLASQQNLFRVLNGLTRITGDPKYKQVAMDAIKYAFENLRSPNGLFYWGGHAAYDLGTDKPCGRDVHELKGFYPYYELMWEIDPRATRQFIEAFWSGHVLDWSSLDIDRHCYEMSKPLKKPWDYQYEGGPLFKGRGFSPTSIGGDLYYSAALLTKFTGDERPLVWAKRLAHRYVETRHPKTGISARVFTVFTGSGIRSDDEVLSKLVPVLYTFPWQGHANRSLWKSHFGYETPSPGTMMNRVTAPWICQLMVGELLGSDGKEFIQWSLEELTAWGKVAYRRQDNTFVPMCYDGTVVEGYVCQEDCPLGLKGSKLEAVPVKITELWAYTLAYCLTRDAFMWEMARNIALANDWGDLGATVDDQPKLNFQTTLSDPYAMVVFLELHRRIGKGAFLRMAQRIGDNILAHRFYKGFVSPDGQYTFTKFDGVDPLALLHLHSALIGDKGMNVPKVWPGTSFFEGAYRSKDPVDDNQLIYSLKGVSEPPKSLQEAAAEGDAEAVKSMIAQGAYVDGREDGFRKTALHRTAISGHKDVAKLLIDAGARLDAKSGGSSPLRYAVERGHKEVAELLIAKGANVNATNGAGDTPLHSAVRAGYKDIVGLLIAKGADVNTKNNDGDTPLHSAIKAVHRDIIELLIAKGAYVNAKNNAGRTPIDLAMNQGRKDIAKLLLSKSGDVSLHTAAYIGDLQRVEKFIDDGVSVDAKDQKGQTALHYAAKAGQIAVANLLIANGADVNAGEWTPLQEAAYYSKEMVELLLAKGANINTGKWTALHSALDAERFDIVELLVAKGADVNIKDGKGRAPLHIAAWYAAGKNPKIVELLLSKGADINAKDNNGKTVLQLAKDNGHTEIVELLRKHGAKE